MRSLFIHIVLFSSLCLNSQNVSTEKINGVNFVSPKYKSHLQGVDSIKAINANWIALCPFALVEKSSGKIEYNTANNWWGDTRSGLVKAIEKARSNKLKILLKPHFWVQNDGWAGDFDASGKLKSEWEKNYKDYILYLAKLSDSLKIEMFCIGTELKTYTAKHPEFFDGLIEEVRKIFKGKITYAANWDEYKSIKFWGKLDFISIDAYFPLSEMKTPEISQLESCWRKLSPSLKKLSLQYNKKIIFTEYGYKSINNAAYKQWEFENTPKSESVNHIAQVNAYKALYNTIWKESFLAGGFLWKWYNLCEQSGHNSDYTPQNKPVLSIIKDQYHTKY